MKPVKLCATIALTLGLLLHLLPALPAYADNAGAAGSGPDPAAVPSAAAQTAAAEAVHPLPAGNAAPITENVPIFPQEHVIQGVSNREDTYFSISKSRKLIAGSYVQLKISHSSTLQPAKSTFTVLLDDVPLGSVFLDKGNEQGATWKLDISSQPLKAGFHKLSLVTHMEVTSNLCDDQDNAANWMRISKESYIHLLTEKSYSSADFSYFPSPFLEKGSLKPLQAAFVVPDAPTPAQLEAAMRIAEWLASQVPGNRLRFDVVHESELTDEMKKGTPLIWVGRSSAWSAAGKEVADQAARDHGSLSGTNYMALTSSPWNAEVAELFIDSQDEAMANAALMLTDPKLNEQLLGTLTPIPTELQPPPDASSEPEKGGPKMHVSFADMGYTNLVVESSLVGVAKIGYTIPGGWQVRDGIGLKLLFKHSKTLNFVQSLVSVKVNGEPIASQHLNAETSDTGSIQVNIPNELFASAHELNIEVAFQFSSNAGKEPCTGVNSQIGNWAVIDKSSFLSFSYVTKQSADLRELPSPLVDRGRWDSAAIVVPERMSSKELSVLATCVGYLGKNLQSASGLALVSASSPELANLLRDKNVIYVGSGEHMPAFIGEAKDSLVAYRNGRAVVQSPAVTLLPGLTNQMAWIQLAKSPFNSDKSLLVVSATSPDALLAVPDVLADPNKSADVYGRLAVIDGKRQVHSFQAEAASAPNRTAADRIKDAVQFGNLTVRNRLLLITGLLAVLIAAGWLFWLVRKRK
ncbi:hypothetical protein SD70_07530 [Gordoniibacillus kamchatkensis]|uniref:Cellulose synthase subunit n=1 Tax=Gordoniibacillus kamchatkensis TaxID=1590651 RepID=A0ABR5AK58_9BACL|nr:cellulose biosynthesis cyclic di-GMP-binding regulatory protein BcsB [Paenibacillus sp. VKM B-2647]KIL41302.1 hypothetical protein SD70_07530 [Paenibacillus sp. VKM B-2647]